ncbi:MAG: tail-specific protease [Porticoccaceae bacterium]|jgi:carboxyl-terminal processing protease|nr:tail-specific protease [Porticoccaceae bacterium]|tara:strand:+ start:162 stop:2300 length:2139 start_codon:yes stop_codon:yes gene_type:complete
MQSVVKTTLIIFGVLIALADSRADSIKIDDGQSALFREILERLATGHYRSQSIDDSLSERYLSEYIRILDSGKNYFLQSDIDEFDQWKYVLDDLSKRGDISPGFIMFNRLRDRAKDRLQSVLTLLEDSSYKFVLDGSNSIIIDGDKRGWFQSEADANSFWEKRITDSLIRLLLNDKDQEEARKLLVKRYQTQIKQFEQRDSQDVLQIYANALASLYDPHTAYFSPRRNENFQISMSLSLEGIGAELTTEDEYTKVIRVIPGGPADLHGSLKAEDKIVGVGQDEEDIVDVIGWRIDDVVALIRGAKDTSVRLEYIPANGDSSNTKIIKILRDKVKLEDKSAQSKILEVEQSGKTLSIGVIEIPAFYMDFEAYRARDPNFKSTTRDVYNLIKELKDSKVDGIVLDLRSNGGGSLFEATSLTDLFIDRGPVVQIRDSNQRVQRNNRAYRAAAYDGPLLVMINRLSASASEIVAGALQDYGRALVVGSQSFGKGTVQDVTPLSKGQLKLTISKFYRVSGDSTQHRGILPDIEFPSTYDFEEVGESQQDNALPWDRIRRVPHTTETDLQPLIGALTENHTKRRRSDPDFVSLVDKIELSDNWDSQKTLSLNLEKRRLRSESWDKQLFEIENKRRQAKGLDIFENLKSWRDSGEEKEDNVVQDISNTEELATSTDLEDEENILEDDPMLYEAGNILGDQIMMMAEYNPSKLVVIDQNE